MKKFDEFNIKVITQYLAGDKIKIDKTLNREITVEAFKIEPSKFEGKGPCLHLQFMMSDNQYVSFGSFSRLIEQIKQVPSDGFPFTTTIIKENNILKFT